MQSSPRRAAARGGSGASAAPQADAQYVANLKQQLYLLELESSILKQHGAATGEGTVPNGDAGPGSEFDALVGKLRESWAQREENLVEALRVVKRDLSKHKQLNYSQQSLISQLKMELQLLRNVKQQDDDAWRRKVSVRSCRLRPLQFPLCVRATLRHLALPYCPSLAA